MIFLKRKEINIKRDKIFLSVVAIIISIYTAFSFTFFVSGANSVKENVVRLHILANSNSEKDQAVKIKVRDALLQKNTKILSDSVNTENVYTYFEESKAELLKTAENVLKENGFLYGADIYLENEYFETREYGEYTFPAGEYLSLKGVLGDGEGHNWWCVMFPPLCVPAADDVEIEKGKISDYISVNGEKVINGGNKYIMKFKILEIYEDLKDKFNI